MNFSLVNHVWFAQYGIIVCVLLFVLESLAVIGFAGSSE